jgi:hypothetical protein
VQQLGDFLLGQTVHFLWSTNGADGASITRATNGTVQVYKDNGTTQSTTGVTDTEDFDSLTGIHACTIDLSSSLSFYSSGSNFTVVLAGATIDGKTVNAVLANFSIMNRSPSKTMRCGQVSNANLTPTSIKFRCDNITEATGDHFLGRSAYVYSGTLAWQFIGVVVDYSLVTSEGEFTVTGSPTGEALANDDWVVFV